MAQRIRHRGPDDEGIWSDAEQGMFLAHRRLSIVDLSPAGHQPMASASDRYVLIFNGEIYNHAALRAQLDAQGWPGWRGHSDTEVLLAGIERWGLGRTIELAVGMFAIALWDRQERSLMLVRDRTGEKPLSWGIHDGVLAFASELHALEAMQRWKGRLTLNPQAVGLLVSYGYIPAPHTVYTDVHKLEPGCWVRFRAGSAPEHGCYWSFKAVAEQGAANPERRSDSECVDELERLLSDAVGLQLQADVPVGAFLSGGIDSSTVVALAQRLSSQKVRTFSIGFDSAEFDESGHARAVAHHLGTDHTDLMVTGQEALAQVERSSAIFDEPFADSSQLPTMLLSAMTRQSVTVSLSGDGGDELFGGYPRHRRVMDLHRLQQRIPSVLRSALAGAIRSVSPATLSRLAGLVGRKPNGHRTPGDSLHRVADMLTLPPHELYKYLSLVQHDTQSLLPKTRLATTLYDTPGVWPRLLSPGATSMYLDSMTYLPDDVLAKVDRTTMSVSLESRVPLLDHRLIEWSMRLPFEMKIRDGHQKWILKQLLYRHVPRDLVDRPKMGFSVPLNDWLRGPLRPWAEDLILGNTPVDDGLDRSALQALWLEHQSGERNWQHALWSVLMLRAWLRARA